MIDYKTYIMNFAKNTCGDILTMNYLACFDAIKAKHEDADFNEFYDVFMTICYNNY